jgi:hypothetical protein
MKTKLKLKNERTKFEPVALDDELIKKLETNAPFLIAEPMPKFPLGKQDGKQLYIVAEEPLNDREDLHLMGYFRFDGHDFLIAWSTALSAPTASAA